MFIIDYKILYGAMHEETLKNKELYQVDRLVSLGLLKNQTMPPGYFFVEGFENGPNSQKRKDIEITSFGKTFYNSSLSVLNKIKSNM